MKVLFLSVYNGRCPHFETELELMANHLEKGDDIYVLSCNGIFDICPSNNDQSMVSCLLCRQRFEMGIGCLDSFRIKIFKLNKRKYLQKIDLLPDKFNNVKELKRFELEGVDFGASVACSLISDLRDHEFDTILHKDRINRTLKASVLIYMNMVDFLKNIKPDISYIYNGRFAFDRSAMRACQKLSFPFFTYDMGKTAYALCKNSFPQDLKRRKKEILDIWDYSEICEEDKKKIGKKWFIDNRERRGVFCKDQKQGLLPEKFDFSKRNVVIFNSSLDELETFPEWKSSLYFTENEGILRLTKAFEGEKNIKFYLRIHPNLKSLKNSQITSLKKLASCNCENLEIIWPEDLVDSYALLDACEKVIVFSSTMGLEASFWGKPVILLGRALYEDLGCCYIPKNHGEAVEMIRLHLLPKNKDHGLKYGHWVLKRCIGFKKFDKDKLTFLGKKLRIKKNLKNRLLLSFYYRLDALRKFKHNLLDK